VRGGLDERPRPIMVGKAADAVSSLAGATPVLAECPYLPAVRGRGGRWRACKSAGRTRSYGPRPRAVSHLASPPTPYG
jgi:hypothetical protein